MSGRCDCTPLEGPSFTIYVFMQEVVNLDTSRCSVFLLAKTWWYPIISCWLSQTPRSSISRALLAQLTHSFVIISALNASPPPPLPICPSAGGTPSEPDPPPFSPSFPHFDLQLLRLFLLIFYRSLHDFICLNKSSNCSIFLINFQHFLFFPSISQFYLFSSFPLKFYCSIPLSGSGLLSSTLPPLPLFFFILSSIFLTLNLPVSVFLLRLHWKQQDFIWHVWRCCRREGILME